ncbi:MAG TPA: hypothetical protein VF032_01195 [Thermoleophilaceae bacterium]
MTGRGRPRSIHAALAAAMVAALLMTSQAAAQPAVPTLILGAHQYPRPFGLTYVYGHAEVPPTEPPSDVAGQTVVLYASTFPFTAWTPVATLTTDFEGYFTYHQTITQNTTYRAIWQTAAPVQSKDRLVKLPMKLQHFRASRTRVKRKSLVTFTGTGAPAHPGATIDLQQADRHGRFRTVSHTLSSSASTFRLRLRVRRSGVYRALFPGDGMFGIAASRPVRVTVR